MPLVRISFIKGKPKGFGQKVGDIVYRTMMETINVPPNDNFQIITEHERDTFTYDPGYLNEGRTVELREAFYKKLAERLHHELDMRMEDVFISLVEVKKENWSFGNGIAQYAE